MSKFNPDISLPYELRREDFALAMQDVYDFFFDVNSQLHAKVIRRFDDMLRPAEMSAPSGPFRGQDIAEQRVARVRRCARQRACTLKGRVSF